eukprot:Phypoly_transcript_05790.p1 GENE.Phypoly_transcript_05790~~Phypoly_transcript_05790.p1  ORF type:complete len:489 (+),score=48.47 Phypoly_transcript_05790:310-1776(+)
MFLLLVSIVLISAYFIYLRSNRSHKHPPGPLCLPIIGSAWALGSNPLIVHDTLTNIAKKYGPIFRIMVGTQPMVVLNDPELIREAFGGTNPPVLLRFTGKIIARLQKMSGENIFSAKDRDFWALLRRMCSPMTRTILYPTIQFIEEEKGKLFAHLDKHVDDEKGVHLNPLLILFTRNVFLRILLGKSWSFDEMTPDQKQFVASLVAGQNKSVTMLEMIPLAKLKHKFSNVWTKRESDGMQHIKHVHNFIKKMVEDKRAENLCTSIESAQDLLDILLLEQKEHPEVSDDSLISTLRAIFGAASATSADTLDWLLLFLCTYPDIQEKCHQEIKTKLNGRNVTMEDQSNLPYLDNVIKETFRLRPAAPIALPRVAERDCTIGGYHVEKGSIVIKNLYGIGNLENFYDNPAIFDPDRWQRNPEKASNLIHFGIGPTICLGMNVAKQEIFLTAASLLQKYKFSISPTSPVPDFIGEFKVVYNPKAWHTSITLR